MKSILVDGNEAVRCVVLDGGEDQNRQATKNALRWGGGHARLVMIGDVEMIASALRPFAMFPTEVECAPVGTLIPQGANVVVFVATEKDQPSGFAVANGWNQAE